MLSNVPGPREQLYFLGCRVDAMYPLGPIIGGAGLNITVMSLNGELGDRHHRLPRSGAGSVVHRRRVS